MFKFEVPSLTVGTLDTLMTLSDDLVKTDSVVESTVRKIERTTAELFGGKSSDLTVGGEFVCFLCFFVAVDWFCCWLFGWQYVSLFRKNSGIQRLTLRATYFYVI